MDEEGSEDAWLERWRHVLDAGRGSPVLELGCGDGRDARFLTERGFPVIATDFSEKALEITRRRAPAAKTQNVDLTRGLPFPNESFEVILASLSLHYFSWRQTTGILADVRRCLRPGGHLLARLNSTKDPHYRVAERQPIENNYYVVEGMPRRLFDRRDLEALFQQGWQILAAEEHTTQRYGGQKLAWEVAARKVMRIQVNSKATERGPRFVQTVDSRFRGNDGSGSCDARPQSKSTTVQTDQEPTVASDPSTPPDKRGRQAERADKAP